MKMEAKFDANTATRLYQASSKQIAESLRQSFDRQLQMEEKKNEIGKLQVLLINSQKDLAGVEAAKKIESNANAAIDATKKT